MLIPFQKSVHNQLKDNMSARKLQIMKIRREKEKRDEKLAAKQDKKKQGCNHPCFLNLTKLIL